MEQKVKQEKAKGNAARTLIYWVLIVACAALSAVFFNMKSFKGASAFGFAGAIGAVLLVCLYFVLKHTNYNVTGMSSTFNLAFGGMLAALVLAGYFLTIRLPIAGKAQIGFGNVFCIFSGLMLGPIYGGLAAGLGSFLYDIITGWADSCVLTFVTKFVMAFVCGLIAWGLSGQKLNKTENGKFQLGRIIAAAVIGSLCYSVLYLTHGYIEGVLLGNAAKALNTIMTVKLAATVTNGIIADVVSIPLFYLIRAALRRSHLAFRTQ
ncbi:MAG: ECF transporter S component [Oscillospiraceae bacterium]|nr:ECF transporter S component [Oscillospiraceae bacterium]MDD3261761.1 ECF transporter S component [Oscillospiraceae bacterium]